MAEFAWLVELVDFALTWLTTDTPPRPLRTHWPLSTRCVFSLSVKPPSSPPQLDVFDAAERYQQAGLPLIVLAGKEYGSGSSRDWAAKGPFLLVSSPQRQRCRQLPPAQKGSWEGGGRNDLCFAFQEAVGEHSELGEAWAVPSPPTW